MDDKIRAFHNVCRHRGNKLVWTDHPARRSRELPAVRLQVPRLEYELDGRCSFILQEVEFFGIDKADYGLVPVHCEVWQGFIFVNLAKEPSRRSPSSSAR
jgi:phenylpropionate dioxygenase-like ring-hydroxylating dioxygenase large terminal subunit